MAKKLICPECGIDLEGMNKRAHAFAHWPKEPDRVHQNKAYTHYHILLEWDAEEKGD